MSISFLILLLLGHILGDFYLQTEKLAAKKKENIKSVVSHSILYLVGMILPVLPVFRIKLLLIAVVASGIHFLIDLFKFIIRKQMKKHDRLTLKGERNTFFIDQCIHLITLGIIAAWMSHFCRPLSGIPILEEVALGYGLTIMYIEKWLLILLSVHKPVNIVIQQLLMTYKPDNKDSEADNSSEKTSIDKNAGRFIGTVERYIILIFLMLAQYSAIGLVLTAKSIARYDKISKDRVFAEYYLLGTLLSTLFVILISFAL